MIMDYNNNYNKRLKLNHPGSSSKQQSSLFGDYHANGHGFKSGHRNYASSYSKSKSDVSTHQRSTRKKSYMSSNNRHSSSVADKPLFSRIFVLYPREINEAEIRHSFQKFGCVQSMSVVKDQSVPTDGGMVYIKYSKASEALRAIEEMDGKFLDSSRSNCLRVLLSEDTDIKGYKSDEPFTRKLYVKIDKAMNRYDLLNMFKKYGEIESSYIFLDRESRESKGHGTVTFFKSSDAAIALEECDPCFQAKFSFPFSSNSPMASKQPLRMETAPVADFPIYDSNNQQPLYENYHHHQQMKEKENLLKHFTSLISHGYDMNNNIPETNNQFDRKENLEIKISTNQTAQNNALKDQPIAEEKIKDQDARVVVRKSVPEVEHPFSIANENLGNDYALRVKTNLSESFLKSILSLIPGLIVFKPSFTFESSVEYLVKYTNDLNTFHALKKINQIDFPVEQFISAEYVREADIKLASDKTQTAADQVLVLVNSEKEMKVDLLKLIFNQFNNFLRCGLINGNKSGYAIFSSEHDATLAVNILDNREIALNHLRVHIEKNVEDFLFKNNTAS